MKPNERAAQDAGQTPSDPAASDASTGGGHSPAGEREDKSAAADDRDELASALAAAVHERDDAIARWQRAQADFQNLRRRTQSDIDAAVRRSQQSLLEGLLIAIDQLELALAAPRSQSEAQSLARGVEMTRAQMLRTLATAGAAPMTELKPGDRFDPARHEAVATLASADREPGCVIEVVRVGYSFGERVLRPAQVIVAAAPAGSADAASGTERGA